MLMSNYRAAALALLALAAACDSPSDSGPPKGPPGVRVVSGAGVTDTVDAILPQPLVVQVNGTNGRPLVDAEIGFFSTAIAQGSDQPTVLVAPTGGTGGDGGTYAIERTDSLGRASVGVRMYRYAMEGGVVVVVPALDTAVVAEYTIQPGAPATVTSTPADTAVLVGGSFAVALTAKDRYGHARSTEGASYQVLSGPAAVAGSTVSGTAIGRAAVVARAGTASDTTWVSVVPTATIAAYTTAISGDKNALYTMRLDGANLTLRVTTGTFFGYNGSMGSAWDADGTRLYYHDSNTDHTRSLYVLELASGATRRLLAEADRMEEEGWPRYGGGWVYFEGGLRHAPLLFRVRPDGTDLQQITPFEGLGTAFSGAPSPDGTRVAFIGSRLNPMPLHVRNIATGEMRSLGVEALTPRWRPDGGEIFYVAPFSFLDMGQIRAIRPDGTGDHAVTQPGTLFEAHFDVSPDGEYLIATTDQGVLTVIQVATGLEMPIRTRGALPPMAAPTWKP